MKIIKILVSVLFVFAFSAQGTLKVSAGMCPAIEIDAGTGHYLVTTASDLSAMACRVNYGDADYRIGIYDLQNDIDLTGIEWVAIGTEVYPFSGEFNGNGNALNHLTITTLVTHGGTVNEFELYGTGLFGYLSNADINDLVIGDPAITVSTNVLAAEQTDLIRMSYVGVVAGQANANTTIDQLNVKNATITVTNTTVMEATDSSRLYSYIGGFTGRLAGTSVITHSEFSGTIDVTIDQEDEQRVFVGGFTASIESSGIENSWLNADITFNSPLRYDFTQLAIGGAAGFAQYSGLSDVVVEKSLIDVTSDTPTSAIGGIAGEIDATTVVERSTFKGEIDSTADNVGGLVGFIIEPIITPSGFKPQNGYMTIINTNNVVADITGHSNVGGLIGYIFYATGIENSWFEGNVIGRGNVGGLVGFSTDCAVTYKISYSLGTLHGAYNIGGITGRGYSTNNLTDVFSRMAITMIADPETVPTVDPNYYAGGLVGWDYGTGSYYEDVYFAGTIVNESSHAAVIDPIVNLSGEPALGTGNYYDHDLSPISSEIGTPKTTAEMKLQNGYDGFNFTETWWLDSRFNAGYAFFDAGFFRIVFDDGTHPYGFLARFLDTLDQPTAPTRSGYVFGGWFTDQQYAHLWSFTSNYVEEDVTLYAKWTEQTPDTGVGLSYGLGFLGIGMILLALTKKTKKS